MVAVLLIHVLVDDGCGLVGDGGLCSYLGFCTTGSTGGPTRRCWNGLSLPMGFGSHHLRDRSLIHSDLQLERSAEEERTSCIHLRVCRGSSVDDSLLCAIFPRISEAFRPSGDCQFDP